ncbi:hypothetical protein A9Q78_03045 [Methylophaga sp. 41_12_T18]|nr:hypothetical protein A9Q78_03045 [Methylophaga sp. 41_12_T18]
MRHFFGQLGQLKSVCLFTAFAIVMSLFLTFLFLMAFDHDPTALQIYVIAAIIPVIIAPIMSTFIIRLFLQVHQLELKMREFAHKDSLTGLQTRRAWFECAKSYYALAIRQKSPFTILMVDLDDFKQINDNYGHSTGDKVISQFSELATKVARESDLIARFGGEEFVFLLPNTNSLNAFSLCERIHHEIRQNMVMQEDIEVNFTVSIGLIAFNPKDPISLDTLISQADDALYQAKSRGKNCSVVYK